MDTNEGEIEATRPERKLTYRPKEQSHVLNVSKCRRFHHFSDYF